MQTGYKNILHPKLNKAASLLEIEVICNLLILSLSVLPRDLTTTLVLHSFLLLSMPKSQLT